MSISGTVAETMVWADKIQAHHPAWLFIALFALLGIYAWIRIFYGSILMQTFQASVSFQVAARMFKDNSILQKQLDNILYVFYLLSVSLILYVAEIRFGLEPYGISGIYLFLFNLAVLVVLFLSRLILVNTAGFLFNRIRIFREYLFNIFIFNKLIGLSVLPLLLFVIYTNGILKDVFQWLTVAALAAILIIRLIRGIVFSLKKDVSIFYIFLYLCALEIAPLVLMYRWLASIL
ncbi:MAG: DUF4271 domain-containing protein [Bacteroidetes bacterium]|nr:DUF4271 domain-containing protein [Bacteroidota bacterium]